MRKRFVNSFLQYVFVSNLSIISPCWSIVCKMRLNLLLSITSNNIEKIMFNLSF